MFLDVGDGFSHFLVDFPVKMGRYCPQDLDSIMPIFIH